MSEGQKQTLKRGAAYVIDAAERPGMVQSIASVFADRGLSMDALVADNSRADPRIIVVFRGSARQCQMVAHVIPRLHDVRAVQVLPLDSPQLRSVILCEPAKGELPKADAVEIHSVGDYLLISGVYETVEQTLKGFMARGEVLNELSRTVLAA